MNQPVIQSGDVAPAKSEELKDAGATTEQVNESELDDVNGGVSLPIHILPYIDPV